jgi:hypothetical protein
MYIFSTKALVHISTAYCNVQLKHISEEIYSENGDPEGIIDLCKVSCIFSEKIYHQSDL